MEVSQKLLAAALLYSAAVGAVLGAFYDVFRVIRVAAKPPPMPGAALKVYNFIGDAAIFAEDIIFSAVSAAVVAVFLFHANNGQVRWFMLAGAGAGFFIYYQTVGRLVMICASAIIAFIRAVIAFIIRVTVYPAVKAVRFIGGVIKKAAVFIARRTDTALRCRAVVKRAEKGFLYGGRI